MSRVSKATLWALATALCAVVIAAPAQAKRFHVTGQQTTITPSAGVTHFISVHGLTVTAIGPASIANGSWTLPIVRGRVAVPSLRGILIYKGGLQVGNATRTVTLRGFVLRRSVGRAVLSADVGGARVALAHVAEPTVSIAGKTGTVTGELRLSAAAAHRIDHMLGKHAVKAGADLGKLTSTITVA